MTEEYERFPALPRRAPRGASGDLAARPTTGRCIAHCFAGKDRTGFTVAVVLETVGVDRDAILADFLRSNDAVPQLRERILESIRNRAADAPEIVTSPRPGSPTRCSACARSTWTPRAARSTASSVH